MKANRRTMLGLVVGAGVLGLAGCGKEKGGAVEVRGLQGGGAVGDVDWSVLATQTVGIWMQGGEERAEFKGDAGKVLYVFFDMQCPHCGKLWAMYRGVKTAYWMKWMPVGLLSRASIAQAATVLGAEKGKQAALMDEHERLLQSQRGLGVDSSKFDLFEGGIMVNTGMFKGLSDKMKEENRGVPLLVGGGRDGKVWMQSGVSGVPEIESKFKG